MAIDKKRVSKARVSAALAANAAMVLLYWDIGRIILGRQGEEGWGAKVIDRLAFDLREAFPDMDGLSSRNLKYMRAFAVAWPNQQIVQRVVARLPWGQNLTLLERLDDPATRVWYAEQVIAHGWSRPILAMNIQRQLHKRAGRAVNNFKATLPPPDSDLAAQVFKDPYLFDFLGTADPRREREVEESLVAHIERFLLELGAGFAFVGRLTTRKLAPLAASKWASGQLRRHARTQRWRREARDVLDLADVYGMTLSELFLGVHGRVPPKLSRLSHRGRTRRRASFHLHARRRDA